MLLTAASALFLKKGYAGATLRDIARDADCDVALVAYYFGSKGGLFSATMSLTLGPSQVLQAALEGNPATVAERLVARVLTAWEDPRSGPQLSRLAREAMADSELLEALRGYLNREIMDVLVEYFGGRHASERAAATIAVVSGMVFSRYILGLAHVTDVPVITYAQCLTPVVARAVARVPG